MEDLSHPAWQWDEQAVQSTNQRMEGLAINAILDRPELLTTGPAAKVPSGKGLSAGTADDAAAVTPQGTVWIGKDFRIDRTTSAPSPSSPSSPSGASSSSPPRRPHWRRGHWHTVLHGEKRQGRRIQCFQPVYVGLS